MQRETIPAGRGPSVGEASHGDAEVIQDDGGAGLENTYKLVSKSSMNERG